MSTSHLLTGLWQCDTNKPYLQLCQQKNGGDKGGTSYREPMERLAFDRVFDIKKSEDNLGKAYIQTSNANRHVLLDFKNFWLILIFQTQ